MRLRRNARWWLKCAALLSLCSFVTYFYSNFFIDQKQSKINSRKLSKDNVLPDIVLDHDGQKTTIKVSNKMILKFSIIYSLFKSLYFFTK